MSYKWINLKTGGKTSMTENTTNQLPNSREFRGTWQAQQRGAKYPDQKQRDIGGDSSGMGEDGQSHDQDAVTIFHGKALASLHTARGDTSNGSRG